MNSVEQFEKSEAMFEVINNQVAAHDKNNLMFNMILHYNFMLNDFSSSVDPTKRQSLI